MPPLLTIGLPVYNAAPFLLDAWKSLCGQTFTDWELIAMDDGSSDESAAALQSIDDPRVRKLSDGRHRGLAARLNQIVAAAAGVYIARMDADDLCHPERLARQVAFLEARKDVDVVGCGLLSFDAELRPVSMRTFPEEHAAIVADPIHGIRLAHATVAGRTEWFREHPYNESNRTGEDWELWVNSYRESRFANLPQALYYYREMQSFRLSGYLAAKQDLARLQWKHRQSFGTTAAALAAAGQYARMAVYLASSLAGAEEHWVRRRGTTVPLEVEREFSGALERIGVKRRR